MWCCLFKRNTKAMRSTKTMLPTIPPAIAPTGSPLCVCSFSCNFVIGVVLLVAWAVNNLASCGSWNPPYGVVILAFPISLNIILH